VQIANKKVSKRNNIYLFRTSFILDTPTPKTSLYNKQIPTFEKTFDRPCSFNTKSQKLEGGTIIYATIISIVET